MSEPKLPDRLYKYQPFTTQSLANLKRRQIWFSKPAAFNDPFDCAIDVVQPKLSDEDLRKWFDLVLAEGEVDREAWEQECLTDGQINDHFRSETERGVREAFATRKAEQQGHGVACLSEEKHDLLMWSHYADGHRGFCLEFDTAFKPFSEARPVAYRSKLPSLNPIDLLISGAYDPLEAMMLTKSDTWKREKEWRVLHKHESTVYTYPWKHLTGIYMGAAMDYAHKEIICLVLGNSPTKVYAVDRSEDEFALASKQVNYSPFDYGAQSGSGG